MAMPGMLIMQVSQVGVVLLILLAAAATAQVKPPQAKPGCTDHCGNLTIPYPFGIGPDCYMTKNFSVNCSESTGPPTATWFHDSLSLTNILADGEIQIQMYIASDCYNNSGSTNSNIPWLWVPRPFTISDTRNKFVAVGCDTYAILSGYRADEALYTIGCVSVCENLDKVENVCSGIGCCQSAIPRGLKNGTFRLSSYYNHSYVLDFNPCSYAFIVANDKFTFSPNTIFEELNKTEKLPMILNWEIGDGLCEEAEKRGDYACKGNSKCVNRTVDNEKYGYICQCQAGYEGNPYLQDGCQDIDECSGSNPCVNGTCKNTAGNYSCLCDKAFRNDEKNERVCIPKNTKNVGSKLTVVLIISLGTGGSLVLLFLTIAAWYLHKAIMKRKDRTRKEKFFKQNGGLLLEQQSSSSEVNVEKTRLFNSRELEKATDRFNVDRVLGQGGQGTVYKGMLTDGRIVAVKKSKTVTEGEVGQFINEIVILSQINHRNVVRLLGCCLETEVPLLVYEFLPNGTVSHYIQHQDEEFPLTWEARLRVAIEVAGALSYLHSAASFPIYHRDIKTTNILLDEKYRAKVADFGTSKSVSIDQTHLTTQVAGTFGYLDPEYFQSSQLTDKSDVYSFGVVLVELLTGEKSVSLMRSQESRSLAAYFLLSMENSRLFEILDAQVIKGGTKEEIMGVANVAQRCLNLKGKKRPTMKVVAAELESLRLPAPIKDSIVQKNSAEDENLSTHEMTTKDCNDDSTSTWYCTSSGTCTGSSLDVHPLLFFNTQ